MGYDKCYLGSLSDNEVQFFRSQTNGTNEYPSLSSSSSLAISNGNSASSNSNSNLPSSTSSTTVSNNPISTSVFTHSSIKYRHLSESALLEAVITCLPKTIRVSSNSEACFMSQLSEMIRQIRIPRYPDHFCSIYKGRQNLKGSRMILKNWFIRHWYNPFPTKKEKELLLGQTGLDFMQIKNWFSNTRKRHWIPIVNGLIHRYGREFISLIIFAHGKLDHLNRLGERRRNAS
ncbi:uncharacterized protein BX663DRAFT_498239 [Cokeromyces recurvatus]|uniref:uncharacterized protein n=1 Tax=Cokeromyces recurvatus TaxID=90255 RepID=UPI0022207984|nr:uncharacterized protein BX663DRAFT_498239 [Cokeromyces recurvatus]KAI7905950.1 hypothetical protein BX663DRAFT_498239 [Cokeromyces recurvatus]